jgi:hypothetical protein
LTSGDCGQLLAVKTGDQIVWLLRLSEQSALEVDEVILTSQGQAVAKARATKFFSGAFV